MEKPIRHRSGTNCIDRRIEMNDMLITVPAGDGHISIRRELIRGMRLLFFAEALRYSQCGSCW